MVIVMARMRVAPALELWSQTMAVNLGSQPYIVAGKRTIGEAWRR